MRIPLRILLLGLIALGVAVAPAEARTSRPDLAVAKLRTPRVVAPGFVAGVSVKVTNRGRSTARRSALGVTLLRTGAKPRKLKARAARVKSLRGRKAAKVAARVVLPRSVPAGSRVRLKVCADARRAVKEASERNNCAASRRLAVSGGTATELIDALVRAKAISRARAVELKLQRLGGSARLPGAYRGGAQVVDDHAALIVALGQFRRLGKADRRRLAPYLAPPVLRDRLLEHAKASADGPDRRCLVFSDRDLQGVPAAGNEAVVWFNKNNPDQRAAAIRYAGYLDEIWPKETRQFRKPKSDAGRCFGGPDGRFDVYVTYRSWSTQPLAQVEPLGLVARDPNHEFDPINFCTDTPSVMTIFGTGRSRFTVAHELMHAIQFAYRYRSCVGTQNGWWDEGGASWAGDWVFPRDDDEHAYQPPAFEAPERPLWALSSGYERQLFWTFLTKTTGIGTMNAIFAQLAGRRVREAVNAAIPGGYARQYPRYLQYLLNRPPVGATGFPARQSFFAWDRVRPGVSSAHETALGAGATVRLPVLDRDPAYCAPLTSPPTSITSTYDTCPEGLLGPLGAGFQHVTFPDSTVREVRIKNGVSGAPGGHLEGWLRLASGRWDVRDWSGRSEVTLCRDEANDDVRELYLVTSNVAVSGYGFPVANRAHELRARSACHWPTYTGHFSATATLGPDTVGEDGSGTETWDGSITFTPATDAELRFTDPGFRPYRVTAGGVSFKLTGHFSGCDQDVTTSWTLPTLGGDSLGTLVIKAGQPRTYQILVGGSPSQIVTGTRSNCEDPTQNGPMIWFPSFGLPGMVATGPLSPAGQPPFLPIPMSGSLTGSAGSPGSLAHPVPIHWNWDLVPRD